MLLKNLKLDRVFTFALAIVIISGTIFSGFALATNLFQKTEAEITSKTLILMKTIDAVWTYTTEKVLPELEPKLEKQFISETIPFYSANEVFEEFRENPEYQEYLYREATLNPRNRRDLARGYELGIINKFIENKNLKELKGLESVDGIDFFYVARPRIVDSPTCLKCHSTPKTAPKSMLVQYGKENGFGWNLGEIVGSQIISIPVSTVFNQTYESFLNFMGFVLLGLTISLFVVKILLSWLVVEPLNQMREVAEAISEGKKLEFEQKGENEIGSLAKALTRMKRSFEYDNIEKDRDPEEQSNGQEKQEN